MPEISLNDYQFNYCKDCFGFVDRAIELQITEENTKGFMPQMINSEGKKELFVVLCIVTSN